jgi:hypothetical protein
MGHVLDQLPPVKLINKLPKWVDQAAYCSDFQDHTWTRNWKNKFYVEFDWKKPQHELVHPIYLPFSIHPYIYRCYWNERQGLLKNPRNIRLLFSGAYNGYKDSGISKILGKMERQEIVEIFRSHPNTTILTNQDQLDEILRNPPSNNFYLIDQDQFRIPPSQWLKVLSHVEVFLCPPGIINVMCHNAHEAMAMGAIPLINYPEWFQPHLEDRKNSYVFSNQTDLSKWLDQISDCYDKELSDTRTHVLDYFEHYQSDDFVFDKIRAIDKFQTATFVMNVNKKLI